MKIFLILALLVFLGLLCPFFLDDISIIRNILFGILCIYIFNLYRYYKYNNTYSRHRQSQNTHYKASSL